MAYLQKLKSTGKWQAQIERNGQRKSKSFQTKREAQAWALEQEGQADRDASGDNFTFGEACDKYKAEVSSKKPGEKWELLRIERFRDYFGTDTLLTEIQQPQIAAWRDFRLLGDPEKKARAVTGGTVLREKNLLNNIFTVARQEWHWIEHAPFTGVKLPQENEEREAMWRWPQIREVLRAPVGGKTKEVVDAFHIALRTAMRLQEVLAAPGLFDPIKQVVNLPPEFDKMKRKRTVPIGRIGARLLLRPAFAVEPNEASTLFADLTASLGIVGLTFHDSRATALTHLARKVDVMRLAKISGHRDIRILQRRYYRERAEDISRLI